MSFILLILFLISISGYKGNSQDYAIGADLSFLKQAEDNGFQFKENGIPKPGLEIFKDHGYNWIRLRLFHTPTELPNDLDYTITSGKGSQRYGLSFFTGLSLF